MTANVTRISHFQNGGRVGLDGIGLDGVGFEGAGMAYYTRIGRLEAQQDLEGQAVADAGAAAWRDIAQVLIKGAEG